MTEGRWERWAARARLMSPSTKTGFLDYLPRVCLPSQRPEEDPLSVVQTFDGPGPWDRTLLEVEMEDGESERRQILVFSSSDYLSLSAHPALRAASSKASEMFGMGVRGSPLVCGSMDHHRRLEDVLAAVHRKEGCVVTATGFAANTCFLTALGVVATLNAAAKTPARHEKIAVFSDSLNHASIIDGLRMMERMGQALVFVYSHCDMRHLDDLLSLCSNDKKVVITDSIFSTTGDVAPIRKLTELRKKHGFLFVVDEAHSSFILGKNAGGIGEEYGVEDEIDVIIGAMSKAIGCVGGFVATTKTWCDMMRLHGRSYIFTAAPPLPVIVAATAAITVVKKESWRRRALWDRIREFSQLTGYPATSPIISLVIGSEEAAIRASEHMLRRDLHVTAFKPPAVPADACRLRISLTDGHTSEDIVRLVAALSECIPGLSPAPKLATSRM